MMFSGQTDWFKYNHAMKNSKLQIANRSKLYNIKIMTSQKHYKKLIWDHMINKTAFNNFLKTFSYCIFIFTNCEYTVYNYFTMLF